MKKTANQNDKRMTVREVADVLGYEVRTIQLKVKELFPEIVKERQATYLNEAQVTAVKLACEKKFAGHTRLEEDLLIAQVNGILQRRVVEAEKQLEAAQIKIAELDQVIEYQTKEVVSANRHADYAVHFMSKEMLCKLDKIRSKRTVRLPYKED